MSLTRYENDKLDALKAIREAMPSWSETIVFNGVGAAASFEDFGDGWTKTIKAPLGYKGLVVGVNIYGITETFTTTTTEGRVDVGTAADPDAFYTGGNIGAATAAAPVNPVGTFRGYIPGDSSFVVSGVAPTGGTPAGRSRAAVTIKWIKE